MLLRLNRAESALLLVNMAMMRKNIRNTFKRNHKKESKELLASFDEVKGTLEQVIEQQEDEKLFHVVTDYHFNVLEIKMLYSFLSNYVPLLEKTVKGAGEKEEDKKQVDMLKEIENKVYTLLEGANVV